MEAALDGAMMAWPELDSDLTLVGDENKAKKILQRKHYKSLNALIEKGIIKLIHAPDEISMEDSIRAIRSKKDASINVGCRMVKDAFDRDPAAPVGFISAGHSGAMMASALLTLGRIPGIERPAIAVTLPTLSPHGCVFLDVGANVDCKPEHLRDFAWMGAYYANAAFTYSRPPRIGVLSNGEERSKGNAATSAALDLIEKTPPHSSQFIGYVEGKEIFKGAVDVVICDGFVGNVVLKSLEGLGSAITQFLKDEAKKNPLIAFGFLIAAGAFRRMKRKLDYAEYGAAPLLGVKGSVFICHGRSNKKAFKNALLRAKTGVEGRFVLALNEALKNQEAPHEN